MATANVEHAQCRLSIENTSDIGHIKEDVENIKTSVQDLQLRLPVWATVLISVLTFLLGMVCGMLYFALNYLS